MEIKDLVGALRDGTSMQVQFLRQEAATMLESLDKENNNLRQALKDLSAAYLEGFQAHKKEHHYE